MSAAGISVFYAGMDLATAKAETSANLKSSDTQVFTAGTWTNTRPLTVLDLSKLPPIRSFMPAFDMSAISSRFCTSSSTRSGNLFHTMAVSVVLRAIWRSLCGDI
jgi:hypothetical protein